MPSSSQKLNTGESEIQAQAGSGQPLPSATGPAAGGTPAELADAAESTEQAARHEPIGPPRRGGAAARPSRRTSSTFASFRHRNYRLWFTGQIVSVVGTWMQMIAQGWLVYELSRSELILGIVGFAAAIPVLLVSPWGGVVTDTVPKRTLLVITQGTSMLMALILAGLTFAGVVQVWHIIVLAAILGIVNAFDAPARLSFVVEMVGREDMTNAIALNSITFNGARVVGPALGGLLLAWLGAAWCFLLNGVSYLAVIACLLLMRLPKIQQFPKVEHPLQKFAEGLRYARGRREIMGLLALATTMAVFGLSYTALLPAFVDKNLHADASAYGAINAFVGVGALTSALIIARFGDSGLRGKMVLGASLVYPLVLLAFGLNSSVTASFALAFGLGFGFMMQANNQNSLLQYVVTDEMRGRVMSLYTLTFFGLSPFGALALGALGERIPLNLAFGLTAVVLLLLSVYVHFRVPEIRRME